MQNSQGELLEGIITQARAETDRLDAETEKSEADRRTLLERQIEGIKREAEESVRRETEKIRKDTEQALSGLRRRAWLKKQEEVIDMVLSAVRKRLADMMTSPEYPDVLLEWITEAAIGLNVPRARINASSAEVAQIDEALIEAVEARVKQLTGLVVELAKAEEGPLPAQGIVATSEDGRVAFNNQVEIRLVRRRSAIRSLIYEKALRRHD